MKRILLTAIFLIAAPHLAFAGPSQNLGPNQILRGNFLQEHHINGVDKPVRSEGHFVVAPDRGVIWAIEKPLPLTIVLTSNGLSHYIGNIPILHNSAASQPFLSTVPYLISNALSGNWKALEPDFKVTDQGTAKSWQVKLVPNKKNLPFQKISAKGSRYVDSAVLTRPDGGLDTFIFKNQTISEAQPTESENILFAPITSP